MKPWEIRPPSPIGNSNENEIFSAVGQALTEWEQVEKACAQLFAIFVSANRRRLYFAPAVRAYGCIISTKSKNDMLREAAKAFFSTRKTKSHFVADFEQVMADYLNFANRRNEIAHGSVQRVFITARTTARGSRQKAIGCYLMPSFYNPKKFKEEKFSYYYTSNDVIHYRQEFTKLALRVGGLYERMRSARRS